MEHFPNIYAILSPSAPFLCLFLRGRKRWSSWLPSKWECTITNACFRQPEWEFGGAKGRRKRLRRRTKTRKGRRKRLCRWTKTRKGRWKRLCRRTKSKMIAGRGSADGLKQEKVAGRGSADGLNRKRLPANSSTMD